MIAACHSPGGSSTVSESSGASWNFRHVRSLISDGGGGDDLPDAAALSAALAIGEA
jgi:hypothetical protein